MPRVFLLLLLELGCTGGRGPVPKRLVAVDHEAVPKTAQTEAESSTPWHHRQSRWTGRPLATAPAVKWTVPTHGPVVHPIRTDGTRVFVVAGGEITAVSLQGEVLWRSSIGADGPVGFAEAGLMVPTRKGVMQVLDPATGELRESHGGTTPIQTPPLPLGPAIGWVDRSGLLTTTSGPYETVSDTPISDAATSGDVLLVGNRSGQVVATTTTSTRWTTQVPGPIIGHPVIDQNRAYVAFGAGPAGNGGIASLDMASGEHLWVTRLGAEPSTPPALGEHLIVPDKNAQLLALDRRHGGIRWRSPASSTFSVQPSVQADAIYAGRHDGRLDRVDMSDGGTVWSVELGGALTGGMCQASGIIFVGTADGRLVAMEAM